MINFFFPFFNFFSKLFGIGECYGGARLGQLGPFLAVSRILAIDQQVGYLTILLIFVAIHTFSTMAYLMNMSIRVLGMCMHGGFNVCS